MLRRKNRRTSNFHDFQVAYDMMEKENFA